MSKKAKWAGKKGKTRFDKMLAAQIKSGQPMPLQAAGSYFKRERKDGDG